MAMSWRSKNPHSAFGSPAAISEVEMRELSFEKRIRKQWENCAGCPVDEDFKEKFVVRVSDKKFVIADMRIWQYKLQTSTDLGTDIPIEFFFDGSESEIEDKQAFIDSFQRLLENVVQERRIGEFRNKLASKSGAGMRKRGGGSVATTGFEMDSNSLRQPLAREETESTMDGFDALEGGAFFESSERGNEDSWKHFLAKDYEGTGLRVEGFRDAGCVLIFVVAQSTLSTNCFYSNSPTTFSKVIIGIILRFNTSFVQKRRLRCRNTRPGCISRAFSG